jgi:hypothetical protein
MIARAIAALLLVLVASSASAECEWMLWERVPQGWWSAARSEAVRGFNSTNSCWEGVSLRRHAQSADAADGRNYDGSKWRCLPDIIDPRGPKESGR